MLWVLFGTGSVLAARSTVLDRVPVHATTPSPSRSAARWSPSRFPSRCSTGPNRSGPVGPRLGAARPIPARTTSATVPRGSAGQGPATVSPTCEPHDAATAPAVARPAPGHAPTCSNRAPMNRSRPLRPLLWMPHESRVSGGHVVQLEQTARALRRLGLDVRTDFSADPDPQDVTLVHGFGLHASDVHPWHWRGVPVVVSSIYWDQHYRAEGGEHRLRARARARALAGRARRAARFALAASRGNWSLVDACLRYVPDELRTLAAFEAADLLLPNGTGEAAAIRRDLAVTTPMWVVPNGVDPERFAGLAEVVTDRDSVVCLGRIEPHKNQLGVIEALRGTGIRLVVAGYEHPDHRRYAAQCRAAGAGWVDFRGEVTEDEATALLGAAKVHVLASWFETTGLVSLEAALAGCNVVSTARGYAREYLGEHAWYCDPADPVSIRGAVVAAWNAPSRTELRAHVLAHYTWDHVGRETAAAYEALMGDQPPPALLR